MRKVIAIDFDGCLCDDSYPGIGKPYWGIIEKALAEKKKGTALILWTCREGKLFQEAIEACERWGLSFDAVNDNLPERVAIFGCNSRKISADEYWDDKAVHISDSPQIDPVKAAGGCYCWECENADINLCPVSDVRGNDFCSFGIPMENNMENNIDGEKNNHKS